MLAFVGEDFGFLVPFNGVLKFNIDGATRATLAWWWQLEVFSVIMKESFILVFQVCGC